MATKNNEILTYDLNSVFNAYTKSVTEHHEMELEALNRRILKLNLALSNNRTTLTRFKMSSKKPSDIQKEIDNLTESLSKFDVLSEADRKNVENDILIAQKAIDFNTSNLETLESLDTTVLTKEELEAYNTRKTQTQNNIKSAQEGLSNLKIKIENDDKQLAARAKVEEQIKNLQDTIEIIKTIAEIKESLANTQKELEAFPEKPEFSIITFKKFLEDNGLSTVHAKELFEIYTTGKGNIIIAKNDFRMRKMHPKRDRFIKKVLIPTAVVCAGIGAAAGVIASSGLVGGSTVMGFIPVSGTPGLTTMATSTFGAAIGLLSTPIVIKTKAALTKAHYRLWYKGAGKNLEAYESKTDLENLRITKLMEKIQNTKHKILKSSGLKKHFLNAINRNRIHHIEAYTKELLELYSKIERDEAVDQKVKAAKLTPIYELLKSVEEFVSTDVAESKAHALLTCDNPNVEHFHASMIENIDIFANLKMYVDRVSKSSTASVKAQKTQAKVAMKNLDQKQVEAYKILNGERLIPQMIKHEQSYGKIGTPPTVEKQEVEGDKLKVTLTNGKIIIIRIGGDYDPTKPIETITDGRTKTVIKFKDGTTKTVLKTRNEVYIARMELLNRLQNDKTFVDDLLVGFKQQTINKLVDALIAFRDKNEEISLRGAAKKLYDHGINVIKAEKAITMTT